MSRETYDPMSLYKALNLAARTLRLLWGQPSYLNRAAALQAAAAERSPKAHEGHRVSQCRASPVTTAYGPANLIDKARKTRVFLIQTSDNRLLSDRGIAHHGGLGAAIYVDGDRTDPRCSGQIAQV